MEGLQKIDEVSYVRFASVYRQFKDINTFMDESEKKVLSATVNQQKNTINLKKIKKLLNMLNILKNILE